MKLKTGRRKEAIARVRLVPGTGEFLINERSLDEYFPTRVHRMVAQSPLRAIGRDKEFDVVASIAGGGVNGQAGALRLGIARALLELDPELRAQLKAEGFLRRDAREKERRKYGLKKARKAPQYSKRELPSASAARSSPESSSSDPSSEAVISSSARSDEASGTKRMTGPIRYGPEPSPFASTSIPSASRSPRTRRPRIGSAVS
jgi:small subunit ribosomal protein S9